MEYFRRIGTDRHKFKVQFFLKTLSCNAKLKGDIYVSIKRGDHKISSQKKVSLDQDGTCDFGKEILCFEALTLFYDSGAKAYQEKQGEVRIIIVTKKGQKKLLGSFDIDIAEYANSGKQNLQYRKQFGEKVKAVLEFDVFIKCLGEASQTSKSVDNRKKQSSLSKFTSFFTGKQSPDEKDNSQDSNKQIKQQKEPKKNNKDAKNMNAEAEKVFKNKYEKPKGAQQQTRTAIKRQGGNAANKKKQNIGSEKKLPEKGKRSNNSDDEDEKTPPKGSKNLVNIKQKDNFTEVQESETDPNPKGSKKGINKQQPIFFDQPMYNTAKKDGSEDDNSKQFDQKQYKMKRTQYSGFGKDSNDRKEITDKNKDQNNQSKKINEFVDNSKNSQIEKLQKSLKQAKQRNVVLQKQNRRLQDENEKLSNEVDELTSKVKSLTESKLFFQTQREGTNKRVDDQRVRSLQKEKGDLLVKIQKLQEKYKKDFAKYEETVEQYEEEKRQSEQASKAQIKRLKEQFTEQKQKLDKALSKLEEKTNEARQAKDKENDLKERLAIAQNNLSQLKLKIGDKLNEANAEENRPVIDVLTLLLE